MANSSPQRAPSGEDFDPSQPLSGVVVVETGEGISVAFCGRVLSDYGATVIKIERPVTGDPLRAGDPAYMDPPDNLAALHAFLNRGKLSVALDLATPPGREQFRRIVRNAAVVTTWSAPADGDLADVVAELTVENPALVGVVISWMGQAGPWKDFACDELLAQHVSGMGFSTAVRVDDPASDPPLAAPGDLAQMVGGLSAATATVIAHTGREATGFGDLVDVSVVDTLVSFLRQEVVTFTYGAGLMSRQRGAVSRYAGVFQQPVNDGEVDFMVRTEAMWRAILDIVGNPEWGELDVFATHPRRSENWDALEPLLRAELGRFTREHVFTEGQRRGVPVAPINTIADAAASPLFAARDFFVEHDLPGRGATRLPGPPFRRLQDPHRQQLDAELGHHTDAVLRWAGATDQEIEQLAVAGVIA